VTSKKYYVIYWTRMEGFLFLSVPDKEAVVACLDHSGYHSYLELEVPNVPE
jgi:hypothetical protein